MRTPCFLKPALVYFINSLKNKTMEEKNFTEKESLELISSMISKTRQRLEVGSGNVFLYYGYSALAISVATFLVSYLTGSHIWNVLWFLMFVPMAVIMGKSQKNKPEVTTYTDRMLENTWKIVGLLMILSVAVIAVNGFFTKVFCFSPMLPLSLMIVSIGSMLTGLTVNENNITAISIAGFIIPVKLLIDMRLGHYYVPVWDLMAGLSFVLTLVIPGHILNRKSGKTL